MAIKTFRPLTPAQRYHAGPDFSTITKKTPEKSLLVPLKKTGGRNNNGRLTSRRRGGGHKKFYRVIDFKRDRHGDAAEVIGIEYDPNRNARIALIQYKDGQKSYIIAPNNLVVGTKVVSGPSAAPEVGNALPLKAIPLGMAIHNVELIPGRGAQMVRTAGSSATLMGVTGDYAQLKLASGEIRQIHSTCYAVIGQVSNPSHEKVKLGKAGRNRWLGRRPRVRGMVMNPVDHPNGGGEAKSKGGGGRQHLVSPWGQVAKGLKTRRKHKPSNSFILTRRPKK